MGRNMYKRKMADMLKSFSFGLAYLIVYAFAFVIILYIIITYFGEKKEPPSFELALISAVIGGLLLSSTFFSKASPDLQLKVRRIGASYLVATLSFVFFIICLPLVGILPTEIALSFYNYNVALPINLKEITDWIVGISIVIGAFSFSIGTVLLAMVILRLWRKSSSNII